MINHVSIGVHDLASAKRFYHAALAPLGYACLSDSPGSLGYGSDSVALWVSEAERPVPADEKSGLHFCFAAPTRESVKAFHAAALAAGGRDNGSPGSGPTTVRIIMPPSWSTPTAIASRPIAAARRRDEPMSETEAVRQLRALNARFIHNFVTNDVPSHDAITHEDFVYVSSEGARRGRREYLKRWATGFDPDIIVYWDYRDERIKVFGNVGLVWSVNKHVIVEAGREVTGMTGYTDTYLREDGTWKCIQAQLVPVASDNYPADATIVRKYIAGVVQE